VKISKHDFEASLNSDVYYTKANGLNCSITYHNDITKFRLDIIVLHSWHSCYDLAMYDGIPGIFGYRMPSPRF